MATTKKKAPKKTAAKKTTKKAAPKQVAQRDDTKALQTSYPHVLRVVKTNDKGKALRVEIACQGTSETPKCKNTREIATQDAFQVTRCTDCQREFSKIRRRKTPAAA